MPYRQGWRNEGLKESKDRQEARFLNSIGVATDELDYRWGWGVVHGTTNQKPTEEEEE